MFSFTKIKFSNILRRYLGILVIVRRYFFSFFLKFVLAQFKCIPTKFKYCRNSNGLKFLFHTLTRTDARRHFKGMFFMYCGCAQFRLYEPPMSKTVWGYYCVPMDSISMCSNTLYTFDMDVRSCLRWQSASTMTKSHHFDSTSDQEPQNLSQVGRV